MSTVQHAGVLESVPVLTVSSPSFSSSFFLQKYLGGLDPSAEATVCDIVRGAIEFDSMEKMEKALEYSFASDDRFKEGKEGSAFYAAATKMPKIKMTRVKDRMAVPTEGGKLIAQLVGFPRNK